MFDDLKQQNNQSGSVPQNPNALPQTPPPPMTPAQPLADMFADVDPVAQNSQSPLVKPSAVQSGKIKPVSNTTFVPSQQASSADPLMFSETSGNKLNKIIIILVVVLLVLALGAGAYYMIAVKGKIKPPVNDNQNTNQTDNANVNNNENTNEADMTDSDADGLTDVEEGQYNTNALLADTDGDSLSDREEVKTYKTDPLAMDTDVDGLNDGEEINVWNTNPLLADTDNDSYPDGTEVKNGYSPIGPGKLATSTPGVIIEDTTNAKLSTAVAWGSSLTSAIILCTDASNTSTLTNYLVGADMCNPKINQTWPIAPDSFPKVCVLDKVIQDATWSFALQSNSPDTLNSVICTQNGCMEVSQADYSGGKVCP
jgi:preprotein translocase subunit SecG